MIQEKYFYNTNQIKIVDQINKRIENENILEERNCAICETSDFKKLYEKDRYGINYYTGICKNCGLMQQYLYPNNEFINIFYEKFYNDLYAFFDGPKSRFESQFKSGAHKYKIIKSHFKNYSPSTVLEIGCGAAGILAYFQSKNLKCFGVDYENSHLDYARSKNIKVSSSLNNIKQKFDIIILSHVLEHIVSFEETLEKCKELCSNEGLIYVEVPSIESIANHYDYEILNYLHIAHVTHFTKKTFINFMNIKGFEIKYINSNIQALLRPKNSNFYIENNFENTINILNNLKIKKKFIYPLKLLYLKLRNYVKKLLK